LLEQIKQVHADNYRVFGARRVHQQLRRQGVQVARCTVERLMRTGGIEGVRRGTRVRTTTVVGRAPRPPDLVNRRFTADRPDQLWLADITYVRTWEGWVYVALVLDAFSRRIVGWQLADHLRTDLPLDALEMAMWQRQRDRPPRAERPQRGSLIHHSEPKQYTSFRYATHLADLGVTASVGSVADSYDNAMAEALNGTFKAELIHRRTWRTRDQVEHAIVEWIAWYNHRRLHSAIGHLPPAEYEATYYRSTNTPDADRRQINQTSHNPGHLRPRQAGTQPPIFWHRDLPLPPPVPRLWRSVRRAAGCGADQGDALLPSQRFCGSAASAGDLACCACRSTAASPDRHASAATLRLPKMSSGQVRVLEGGTDPGRGGRRRRHGKRSPRHDGRVCCYDSPT
jgi:transposase InsO family protein